MTKPNKGKIIEKILALTQRDADAFFDKLSDRSAEYLEKLLKMIHVLR